MHPSFAVWFLAFSTLTLAISVDVPARVKRASPTCSIVTDPDATDDAPVILAAFEECEQGGNTVFLNQTYNINSVMNTTGLNNVNIDIRGTLLWGTNIIYWLVNSLPVGCQNQSSAWFLGGHSLVVKGSGYGTLNGNRQAWYDYTDGVSNLPGRPHALTIWETRNAVFEGLRFVQSQMWTMAIIYSSYVTLEDIYVNFTTDDGYPACNTDGADTIYSDHITFNRWTVANGDECISIKANSTDTTITNSVFYKGLGVAIGSIGQLLGQVEIVENVYVNNITAYNTAYAAYVKTWTGEQVGYPPNGEGGELGCVF